jgi:hypothetical protein
MIHFRQALVVAIIYLTGLTAKADCSYLSNNFHEKAVLACTYESDALNLEGKFLFSGTEFVMKQQITVPYLAPHHVSTQKEAMCHMKCFLVKQIHIYIRLMEKPRITSTLFAREPIILMVMIGLFRVGMTTIPSHRSRSYKTTAPRSTQTMMA